MKMCRNTTGVNSQNKMEMKTVNNSMMTGYSAMKIQDARGIP